ncbi:endonuclease/exonuclease/phosphatase family protein [Cognatilysobacter lacus]|uniref:Endonuclease/exonuclease/phosphatase family protein n=1 Tax=Cognatilysobacter lacus TaxID=1643323 RepID=A0A5D8Z0J2_9GAMM|nr:endonuclease/exonuclease/phosphatase family protein [Lysobacter lacus]TZF88505.1 endonuclease/exonuclease/phosphatase family protein [Lysobacter lacus]
MTRLLTAALLVAALIVLAACVRVRVHGDRDQWAREIAAGAVAPLRIATYNTSLNDDRAGGLIQRLEAGDANARKIAAVLQRVRPDIVLLNEFDYDDAHRAADLFQQRYLEVPQAGGGDALRYPYRFLAPVNTGVPSGFDLDRDGHVGGDGRAAGNDAWGFGLHPGQYGMLLLSRYPIDANDTRTFQHLLWKSLPNVRAPRVPESGAPWYSADAWARFPLSSKSHWDVPVRTPFGRIHVLAAHPTPPVFDGPENRNGLRNFDEIRLWAEYLTPGVKPWLCDDRGRCGGLPGNASFVILGDHNADPVDGDGEAGAIAQLLGHPRVNANAVPTSDGAPERARHYGFPRKGDVATHTGDFGPSAGTLRLDYVLPSRDLPVRGGGVFWPAQGAPGSELIDASDHHLVWLDIAPR